MDDTEEIIREIQERINLSIVDKPNKIKKKLYFLEIKIVLMNNESQRSKAATLFFLSKNYYNLEQIVFPNKWKDFWSYCDILVTDNPKLLKIKPKDKISIKVKNDFNVDIKSNYTIIDIKELFKILKNINKEKNGKK